jgi:Ca2+-binding EF-hand superfamily protein
MYRRAQANAAASRAIREEKRQALAEERAIEELGLTSTSKVVAKKVTSNEGLFRRMEAQKQAAEARTRKKMLAAEQQEAREWQRTPNRDRNRGSRLDSQVSPRTDTGVTRTNSGIRHKSPQRRTKLLAETVEQASAREPEPEPESEPDPVATIDEEAYDEFLTFALKGSSKNQLEVPSEPNGSGGTSQPGVGPWREQQCAAQAPANADPHRKPAVANDARSCADPDQDADDDDGWEERLLRLQRRRDYHLAETALLLQREKAANAADANALMEAETESESEEEATVAAQETGKQVSRFLAQKLAQQEHERSQRLVRLRQNLQGMSYGITGRSKVVTGDRQDPDKLMACYDVDRDGMLNLVEFRAMVRMGGKMAEKQLPEKELRLLYKEMGGTLTAGVAVQELTDFVWRGQLKGRITQTVDHASLAKPAVIALCQHQEDLPALWKRLHPDHNTEQIEKINSVEVGNILAALSCTVSRDTVVYMMRQLGAEVTPGRELLSMPFVDFMTMLPQLVGHLGLVLKTSEPEPELELDSDPDPEADAELETQTVQGPVLIYQLTSDTMVNRVPRRSGSPRSPVATKKQQQQTQGKRAGRAAQTRRETTEKPARARSRSRATTGKNQTVVGQQSMTDDPGHRWLAAKGRAMERET